MISDIIWYLSFSFWPTSLSLIIFSCIHVAANGIISFFMTEWYSIVYVYHIFFIYSSVNGRLVCFHALAIINSCAFIFWLYCLVCQPLIILNLLKASGKHHVISHLCEFSHGVLSSWHLTFFFSSFKISHQCQNFSRNFPWISSCS